ncbi:DUF2834 domain-containing protein [Roseibium sp. MMSF_3544]|uniref:DUF2834 domain-containing protein n=1 Tax=unclassified Roseibium TaxID=2629323 RepID=UPI00273F152C|nr:DUF2834 domain-containing protein [Roseibium sp. MMSF_3544]
MKTLYLAAAIFGTLVPWLFFAGFIAENGVSLPLFVAEVFATRPATGFAADLLICCAVFWIWSWRDARENAVPGWWLTLPAVWLVGLSLALPLYLWMRERARESHE